MIKIVNMADLGVYLNTRYPLYFKLCQALDSSKMTFGEKGKPLGEITYWESVLVELSLIYPTKITYDVIRSIKLSPVDQGQATLDRCFNMCIKVNQMAEACRVVGLIELADLLLKN
jgi:hypothetical protein